jgi:diadenosine tetraphosphate (Ap4A) HIT family hydrolase
MAEPLPLPDFVSWPIFPFVGDLHVRPVEPRRSEDHPRDGEPGGSPCRACSAPDDDYLWVDERWRVSAPDRPSGAPVQLFLESRDHLDLDDLDEDLAAEMGRLIVRLDRAIQAVGGIGRVHVNRWGDGGSHLHLWFYGRPVGDTQMIGFCLPLWAMTLPPTQEEAWNRNLEVVARELARHGGRAVV